MHQAKTNGKTLFIPDPMDSEMENWQEVSRRKAASRSGRKSSNSFAKVHSSNSFELLNSLGCSTSNYIHTQKASSLPDTVMDEALPSLDHRPDNSLKERQPSSTPNLSLPSLDEKALKSIEDIPMTAPKLLDGIHLNNTLHAGEDIRILPNQGQDSQHMEEDPSSVLRREMISCPSGTSKQTVVELDQDEKSLNVHPGKENLSFSSTDLENSTSHTPGCTESTLNQIILPPAFQNPPISCGTELDTGSTTLTQSNKILEIDNNLLGRNSMEILTSIEKEEIRDSKPNSRTSFLPPSGAQVQILPQDLQEEDGFPESP
eukprot:Gb_10550 [translate_table: standard]